MAFWVTVRGGKTLVSRASSESAARTEAENKGFAVEEVTPVSADVAPEELAKHEQISTSGLVAFQIFCLTAGQVASILACVACVPLTVSMFAGASDTPNSIEVWFMALLAGTLLFCTGAATFIVYSYVKRQLKP